MLGKPDWFQSRKYTGWGLTPKTWQGWAYLAVMVVPVFAFNWLYRGPGEIRIAAIGIWALIFVLDTLDIMARLKKDERETMHEAIAERNAAWFMVLVLAIGIAYQAASSAVRGMFAVDPFIIAALFGAMIIKMATNICLERKN
ncbi:MAG TPA: hypothetical protein HA254_00185 [Candidatus Diapherotrites archaeon]|uniref:Uncharacterized protein n=1 Tax=Candidatus Iainarchaeum sp. TaxID=3101447 RepID=A0A7J4IU68_9ARCH|nr:hypothetical protein [Candidatus Diapherotrites archaeon]